MPVTPTRCRICESACGLLATVEDQTVTRLAPDPDHPLSRGYACRKGPAFTEVQNHPRRVTRPLLRPEGWRAWEHPPPLGPTSWEDTLTAVGTRLSTIADAHGPDSVGLFLGNASGHSLGAVLGGEALRGGAGTRKTYSALTLDNSEMFVVLEQVMGNPMASFLADYEHADLVVLIGTDPVASQPSQIQSRPGAIPHLLDRARDDQLIVVDPRRSDTARRASLHLRPRPGGDAAMLAWLVREALASPAHRRKAETDPLLRPGELATLAKAMGPFDVGRAAAATGLSPDELRGLRDHLLAAERPLVWSGLGVLLGPDGTVGYWLTVTLQALLSGIDRRGGYLHQRGAIDLPTLTARIGTKGSDPALRSRIGGFPAVLGTVASATLADDVLTPGEGQLKALVVVGGNPAVSLPDTVRAQRALSSLDLLVCVDLFVNDTGALADAVLPAATGLERDESALHTGPQRPEALLAVDRAVTHPRGDCRTDWRILLDLCRAAGWAPFGSRLADLGLKATGIGPLGIGQAANLLSPLPWRAVAQQPGGAEASRPALGQLRERGTDHQDGRLHLAVPSFLAALAGTLGADCMPNPAGPGHPLQLVTSVRPVETMNSWLHHTKGADRRAPVARLHPDDLAALGTPERIRLRRPDDDALFVDVAAVADDGMRRGVVTLPYGWGHHTDAIGAGEDGPRGVNANVLVATNRLEPFTGQPLSNSQWVLASAHASPEPEG